MLAAYGNGSEGTLEFGNLLVAHRRLMSDTPVPCYSHARKKISPDRDVYKPLALAGQKVCPLR